MLNKAEKEYVRTTSEYVYSMTNPTEGEKPDVAVFYVYDSKTFRVVKVGSEPHHVSVFRYEKGKYDFIGTYSATTGYNDILDDLTFALEGYKKKK